MTSIRIIIGRRHILLTDQPGGREHGQVKLAIMSSKLSPENRATSKVEYTNTQQDLPDYWNIVSRLLDMQGF